MDKVGFSLSAFVIVDGVGGAYWRGAVGGVGACSFPLCGGET